MLTGRSYTTSLGRPCLRESEASAGEFPLVFDGLGVFRGHFYRVIDFPNPRQNCHRTTPRRCSGLDAVAECPAQSGDRLLPIHAAHGRRIGAFAEFAPDEQGQLGAIGKGFGGRHAELLERPVARVLPEQFLDPVVQWNQVEMHRQAGHVTVATDIDASRPQQRVHFAFDPGQQRPEFGEGLFRQLVEGRRRLPRAEHAVAGQGRVDPLVQRPVAGLVDDQLGRDMHGRRSADGAPTVTRRQGRSSPVLRRFISSMRCRSARRWASGLASHQSRTAELS